jgi:hypothetical protein
MEEIAAVARPQWRAIPDHSTECGVVWWDLSSLKAHKGTARRDTTYYEREANLEVSDEATCRPPVRRSRPNLV